METLEILYMLDDELIREEKVDKIENIHFIESLKNQKQIIIDDEKFIIVGNEFSTNGNLLTIKLGKYVPYVGYFGGVEKRY